MSTNDSQSQNSVANDQIDLLELFETLWRERVTIVAITVLIVLLSGAATFIIPPTYQASIQLFSPQEYQIIEEKKIGLFDIDSKSRSQSQSQVRAFEGYLAFLRSSHLHSEISALKGAVVAVNTPKRGATVQATLKVSASSFEGLESAVNGLINKALFKYQDSKRKEFEAARGICREVLALTPKGYISHEADSACLKSKNLIDVKFDESYLKPFASDVSVLTVSNTPVKPRRTLILALSLVGGFFLAVVFVLVRNAVRNRKVVA